MALAGNIGASIAAPNPDTPLGWLFGEDQARYLVTCPSDGIGAVLRAAMSTKLAVSPIGTVGGDTLICEGVMAVPLAKLRQGYENWFPAFMSQRA